MFVKLTEHVLVVFPHFFLLGVTDTDESRTEAVVVSGTCCFGNIVFKRVSSDVFFFLHICIIEFNMCDIHVHVSITCTVCI